MSVPELSVSPTETRAGGGEPLWLETGEGGLYAVLHSPSEDVATTTAVLMLPTFGWEETCAYRARRSWAIELARAGFPTLRMDLPGTGESWGGPREPGLVDSWLASVDFSARWLRTATQCARLAVVGVGLGGLLAVQAMADGAPLDELILWGVPARGRALARELRIHAGVVDQTFLEDIQGHELDNGDVSLTGYLMTAETVGALERIRLDEAQFPADVLKRVLLLDRDRLPVDAKLQHKLADSGATVTVESTLDFHLMMEHPGLSGTPLRTIARSIRWLGEGAGPATHTVSIASAPRTTGFSADGRSVKETLVGWDDAHGRIQGVVSEPADGPRAPFGVVMLNAGALRRTGPTRLWVELSRHWAAQGIPVARIDVEGVGDSGGDPAGSLDIPSLHTDRRNLQTRQVLDHLQEAGMADRFVFVGLCSGAYWGTRAALDDDRVTALLLLNLWAFQWHPEQVAEVLREAAVNVLRSGVIRRVMRDGISREDRRMALEAFRDVRSRAAAQREAQRLAQQDLAETEDALSRLRESNTRVLLMLSRGERLALKLANLGFMDRLAEWPNLTVEELPTRDHDLRAPWLQALIKQRLDAALEDLTSGAASA